MNNSENPAFPLSDLGHGMLKEGKISFREGFGLTKREYFAAMAMQGILSVIEHEHVIISKPKTLEAITKSSVMLADSLLSELSKEKV